MAFTARDGAVGTWLRWTPIQALHLRGRKGHCSLFMSAFHLLSLAERGETSAIGMMTSSASPRTRQTGAAIHVPCRWGKAPTSLLTVPSSVCPLLPRHLLVHAYFAVSVPSGTQSRVRPPDPGLQDRTSRPSSGPGQA